MLIEYIEVSPKRYEPKVIGIAPLDAAENIERWRLSFFYYDPQIKEPIKIRDIEGQKKWSERALYA